MSAGGNPDVRRGQMVHGLFWIGVGAAPLAILVLLFSRSTDGLRVAVALAVVTIVLLAVSIALRPNIELMRMDIEERVLDEVEQIRVQIREDINRAGQHTHRVLGDQIRELAGAVAAQRGQVAELLAQVDDLQTGGVLPASSPVGSRSGQPGGPGVVRRTETVHVTHRTTTVDAGDDPPGTVYGSRTPVEGEWHERGGRAGRAEEPRYAGAGAGWDGLPAGGRWALLHSDEHGQELRLGERRSSMHSGDRGAEFHVEDRWAAMRRDEPRDGHRAGGQHADPRWEQPYPPVGGYGDGPRALPSAHQGPAAPYLDYGRAEDSGDEFDYERERARPRGRQDPRANDPRVGDPRAGDPRAGDPRAGDPRAGGPGYPPRPRGPHPSEYGR